MTPEQEADMRARASVDASAMGDGAVLFAEIDRLRALPVLRTCGECRHYHLRSCEHPSVMTPGRATPTEHDAEPPSWCPERGKR